MKKEGVKEKVLKKPESLEYMAPHTGGSIRHKNIFAKDVLSTLFDFHGAWELYHEQQVKLIREECEKEKKNWQSAYDHIVEEKDSLLKRFEQLLSLTGNKERKYVKIINALRERRDKLENKISQMEKKESPDPKKEKPKYRRTGRCDPRKCGAFCCRCGPYMVLGLYSCAENRLLRMFNWRLEKLGKKKVARFTMPCINLNGIRCEIYKKRPSPCRDFPEEPSMPWYRLARKHGCTYTFKRIKGGKA